MLQLILPLIRCEFQPPEHIIPKDGKIFPGSDIGNKYQPGLLLSEGICFYFINTKDMEPKKIPFHIEINIANIPNRYCRFFQEQIVEYLDDGKARFEWDRLRQSYMLGRDYTIEEICGQCPLNIVLDVEGCKGELFDFDVFLKMLPNVKPDSMMLQKNILNSEFDLDETRLLIDELEKLQEYCNNITWPVAQVFYNDEPLMSEDSVRYNNYIYYEWSGDDDQIFFTSNNGYHIGISSQGIILKKTYGETIPHNFVSITRKGVRVMGTTAEGNMVPIPMNRACLPEWVMDDNNEESDLRFTSLPISGIFQDIFNMLIVYSRMALKHYTGVSIFSKFYRRV